MLIQSNCLCLYCPQEQLDIYQKYSNNKNGFTNFGVDKSHQFRFLTKENSIVDKIYFFCLWLFGKIHTDESKIKEAQSFWINKKREITDRLKPPSLGSETNNQTEELTKLKIELKTKDELIQQLQKQILEAESNSKKFTDYLTPETASESTFQANIFPGQSDTTLDSVIMSFQNITNDDSGHSAKTTPRKSSISLSDLPSNFGLTFDECLFTEEEEDSDLLSTSMQTTEDYNLVDTPDAWQYTIDSKALVDLFDGNEGSIEQPFGPKDNSYVLHIEDIDFSELNRIPEFAKIIDSIELEQISEIVNKTALKFTISHLCNQKTNIQLNIYVEQESPLNLIPLSTNHFQDKLTTEFILIPKELEKLRGRQESVILTITDQS